MENNTDDSSIHITYEKIFDTLMNEKNREELQELEDNFMTEVKIYIKTKKILLEKQKESMDFSNPEQIEKEELQIKNTEKIIKEIIERRIRKIVHLAIDKMKRGDQILINTDSMNWKEQKLFDNITKNLNEYYRENIDDIIKKRMTFKPATEIQSEQVEQPKQTETQKKEEEQTNKTAEQKETNESDKTQQESIIAENTQEIKENQENQTKQTQNEQKDEKNEQNNPLEPKDLKSEENKQKENTQGITPIKIIDYIPKFVGPDLQIYGPYEQGDMASLPTKVAELLINKEKAKKIE